MRKLNNKGFAVTTLLYGTLILIFLSVFSIMAYMSANRSNTKKLTDEIKSELTSFGRKRARFSLVDNREDTEKKDNTSHTSGTPYYVAANGNYFIQLFGAQGGDKDRKKGGKGAYTSGIIYLEAGTTLYFHIGGQGDGANCYAGIGGGGFVATNCNSSAPGGGATYLRYGTDTDTIEKYKVIMVAAGGGGATTSNNGGDGGNLKGKDGSNSSGGGQNSLSSWSEGNKTFPNFLTGGSSTDGKAGAGGGGYYGGEAGKTENASGAGGSSYIAGYAGVGDINDSKSPYFINGVMIPGINTGAGYATITKIDDTFSYEKIKSIIGCGNIKDLQAISSDGKNVVTKDTTFVTTAEGEECHQYNINATLSEIAIWYNETPTSFKTYIVRDDNNTDSLSATAYNLKKDQTDGIRYSLSDKITSDGAYYLISSDGKFYSKNDQKFVEFNKNSLQDYIIKFTDSSFNFDGNQIKVTGTGNSYYIYGTDGKVLKKDSYFFVTDDEIDNDQEYQLKLVRVYE